MKQPQREKKLLRKVVKWPQRDIKELQRHKSATKWLKKAAKQPQRDAKALQRDVPHPVTQNESKCWHKESQK